jgi:hypothetical protein
MINNIDEIRFVKDGQGIRENFGFNNLIVESKYNILNGQSSNVTSNTVVPYLDVQKGGEVQVNPNTALTVNSNLINDGSIIFRNDNSGSGQLDTSISTISGNGVVTVERFITVATEDTRAFRFFTSAVNSTDPIYDNWQEGGNSPAGLGTHITGT